MLAPRETLLGLAQPTYLDSSCTELVAIDRRTPCDRERGEVPTHVILEDRGDPCGNGAWRVYRLDTDLGPMTSVYQRDPDGNCQRLDLGTIDDGTAPDVYEISEVPPETFVAAEFVEQGERLLSARRVADDGASELAVGRPYDASMATGCFAGLAADGILRCLPIDWSRIGYADASCSEPLWPELSTDCPADPRYPVTNYAVARETDDACLPQKLRVYELGAASVPSQTYSRSANECLASDNDLARAYHSVVDELPPESFVALSLQEEECGPFRSSGSRLVSVGLIADDGYREPRYFLDTELGEHCYFQTAADGELRCLPARVAFPGYYADAACTQRAAVFDPCAKLETDSDPHLSLDYAAETVSIGEGECAETGTRIYTFTGPELDVGYEEVNGECSPVEGDPDFVVFFKELGPELPAETFVAATEVH